ncbi:hypothetical protein EW145_g6357, partial [Phellinidium pouzarii]
RVPFAVSAKRADTAARVAQAEGFFLDALEEWRAQNGAERVTLVGHSLGAYLATAYALRHPERVAKLVLLRLVEGSQKAMKAPEPATKERVKEAHDEQREKRDKESYTRRFVTYLWEEGCSPFQVVRSMTVFGPMLVGRYITRRFDGFTDEETRNMNDYLLNITLAKGSGEYCISHILAPFAHARQPLVDRISALKIPVVFVYGSHDWMDAEGGTKSIERLRAAGNRNASIYIVDRAGHHVYLDNPDAVNELLLKELSTGVQ